MIHDFPDAGISANSAEYLTVSNNVVYNNGWWTTGGTHGISVSQMVSTPAGSGQETIQLTGNLVFGNQSLMISHVFSKGSATLAIDEGNGLHLQDSNKTYTGYALLRDNLLAFNGKAGLGINTMAGVKLLNNDFYLNARTVDTGELRLQSSPMSLAAGNLFQPRMERMTIDDAAKAYTNVGVNATTGTSADGVLYPSVQRLPAVFANADTGDFTAASSVPAGMGVSVSNLDRMKAKISEYGITLVAPNQVIDNDYLASVKKDIFSSWPLSYSNLVLNDPLTGYSYTYAQRCNYPSAPGSATCA